MTAEQLQIRICWAALILVVWFFLTAIMLKIIERGHTAAERAAQSRAFYNHFIVGEPLKPLR